MNRPLLNTFALVLLAALIASSCANAADVNYIKSKIGFYYVADPNDANGNAEAVDVQKVLDGTGTGGIYTAASAVKLRNLVKAVCGGTVSGTSSCDWFRDVVGKVLKITGRDVRVFLINDKAAQITNAANITRYGISVSDGYAWPVAICGVSSTSTCSISLGAYWLDDTGQFPKFDNILETFCHELMHTQDLSADRTHIYGNYYYGLDGTHYFIEAIPDMGSTYAEGIANVAGYWYNHASAGFATNWFAQNGFMIVEKKVPPGQDAQLFLYTLLKQAGVPEVTAAADITYFEQLYGAALTQDYAVYRIRTLPADMIKQNEQIIALILYHHAMYTSFDDVIAAVKQVNPKVYQTCDSAFARLIEEISKQEAPAGVGSPDEYLLTIALCDYFTLFKSASKTEFAGVFENMLGDPWIDAYWAYRDAVKSAVNVNNPTPDDITNIADVFGITSTHSRTQ